MKIAATNDWAKATGKHTGCSDGCDEQREEHDENGFHLFHVSRGRNHIPDKRFLFFEENEKNPQRSERFRLGHKLCYSREHQQQRLSSPLTISSFSLFLHFLSSFSSRQPSSKSRDRKFLRPKDWTAWETHIQKDNIMRLRFRDSKASEEARGAVGDVSIALERANELVLVGD